MSPAPVSHPPARLAPARKRSRRGPGDIELRLARQVQQNLFPPPPHLPGYDAAGLSVPAGATGGDYFDFIPLADGRLAVAIGDVSGHGLAAALLMATTRAYLRGLARAGAAPGEVLAAANRALEADTGPGHFVTLCLAALDPLTGQLAYSSAGHPCGYVLGADGAVKGRLESTGMPLGVLPEAEFPEGHAARLAPGDLVVFLTDGLTEAEAPDGTPFGARRALDIVRVYRRESARCIAENLYHAVRAFAHNRPQADDLTAVVVKKKS